MRIDSWLKISPADNINYNKMKALYTNVNPEWQSCVDRGYSTNGVSRFLPNYEEHEDELWLPRNVAKEFVGRDIEDYRVEGKEVDFKSKIVLRDGKTIGENQFPFVDALYDAVVNSYGAIGQAGTGFGKTITVLEVIARLKRTALVIVHTEFLMEQWVERIKDSFDITDAEIGIVQQDKCQYRDKKIVVAIAQSLIARDYGQDFYNYFGTVVVDECHRFAAPMFRKSITLFPAKYRIGVSATPKRADGLEGVFFSHIGEIAVVGEKRKITATIFMVDTPVAKVPDRTISLYAVSKGYRKWAAKQLDFVDVVSYLVDSEPRNKQIVRLLKGAVEKGRKILLLSGRRKHLDILKAMLEQEMPEVTVGYFVGQMKSAERAESAKCQILLGTYQIAKEGLDLPELDTLVLATPQRDIIQAVGRILRELEGKQNPVVIDLVDKNIGMCAGLSYSRKSSYRGMSWIIK